MGDEMKQRISFTFNMNDPLQRTVFEYFQRETERKKVRGIQILCGLYLTAAMKSRGQTDLVEFLSPTKIVPVDALEDGAEDEITCQIRNSPPQGEGEPESRSSAGHDRTHSMQLDGEPDRSATAPNTQEKQNVSNFPDKTIRATASEAATTPSQSPSINQPRDNISEMPHDSSIPAISAEENFLDEFANGMSAFG